MTDQPTKTDANLILLDRLCAAHGKDLTKKQADEWLAQMDKFRIDESAIAIQSLIETINRFPTIAEYRTACMQAWTVRLEEAKSKGEEPVPPIVQAVEARALEEAFEWWRDRFGTYAKNTRNLVSETCEKAERRWNAAKALALTIHELDDELEFEERDGVMVQIADVDHQARYDRMVEVARSIAKKNHPTAQPMPEDIIGF